MAEPNALSENLQDNKPLSFRAKLLIGLGLSTTALLVAGMFIYGMSNLTTPAVNQNSTLQERLAATRTADEATENLADNQTEDSDIAALDGEEANQNVDLDGDGVIDFNGPDYRYYAFETPFVSNLDNSKKLLTLELSLLIKRPAFFVDAELEKLMNLAPAFRSQILNYLITLSPDELKSRSDRQTLSENIRQLLNDYLKADQNNEEEGILEVQILKMVVA